MQLTSKAVLVTVGIFFASSLVNSEETVSGAPAFLPASEADRLNEYHRIWGQWPPTFSLPSKRPIKDSDAWIRYQAAKEAQMSAAVDDSHQWKWEQVRARDLCVYL
jgi:hypothetical protein